ncbi:MAG: hypothetical protein IJ731_06715 [Eubacterium sp.]|nr:hypothetical protein [Eubacterium sp.]
MGGFTVNGFGAADSYYQMKSVGHFYCNCCNREQEFFVMELKRKVKVLYIPTVSLYSKYAVVCNKCKNGYYIEENVKDDIMYGRATVIGYDENGPKIKQIEQVEHNKTVTINEPDTNKEVIIRNNLVEDKSTSTHSDEFQIAGMKK